MQTLANIFWLGPKELRGPIRGYVLLALIVYAFPMVVALPARSNSQELHNASVAIVDEDCPVL